MATFVLTAAAKWVGSTLALSGWQAWTLRAAAAVAGTYLDARLVNALTPNQRIDTPAGDFTVTSATEGAVIPRVYGAMPVGGNLIWASDSRFEESTSEQGGKGGGGVEVTERRFFRSFAVGLSEGPIAGVGRIWADGKPFDPAGATVRLYLGAEDQMPDPWIESIEGEGDVEAFRGTAYLLFEDLDITPYGNRIPQFKIEVFNPVESDDGAGQLLKAVNLIPSAGEYVYATETVLVESGLNTVPDRPENVNSTDARPDILVSLDQLEAAAPNLESVSLVVSWFGDDLRCGSCTIQPGVEFVDKQTNVAWSVNGIGRLDAYVITRVDDDPNNGPNYGGTPSDRSVVQAIREIKARGKKVTFYPFILMDVPPWNTLANPYSDNAATSGQAAFPWRGRITCSPAAGFEGTVDKTGDAATQVAAFFGAADADDFDVTPGAAPATPTVEWTGGSDWGFRRFILHYAHLCAAAGGVDAFLIGSEMRGLTQIRSDADTYPTVAELIDLAAEVRSIFDAAGQTDVEISYAADWSEYFGHQPTDGSDDVYFHLDALWADAEIDFVGIDNYVPLSDWREGSSHLDAQAGWRSIYDVAYLQSNIEGGEGFDWYYASPEDRDAQTRSPITDSTYGKPWVYRYKDIRSWWLNEHYDRPGGVESMTPTAWVPESKPIRFTEAGCPAVDKGTNQPNVFYDPKSSESFLPYYSRAGGVRDDAIQRRYLDALLGYWADAGNNPISSVYSGPMVHDEIAIWTWDARPYPAFPGRTDIWADAPNWRLGHWITGRLGGSSLGALVEALCVRAGVDPTLVDVTQLSGVVQGYAVTAIESARASIAPLMVVQAFDPAETAGQIRFTPRGGAAVATIDPGELVVPGEADSEDFDLTRAQETELPRALKWRLIRSDEEYGALTVEARRTVVDTARIASEQYPIAMAAGEADAKVKRALKERWLERETGNLILPPSRLALDPTDPVYFNHDGRLLEYRLGVITDGEARRAELTRTDAALYTLKPGAEQTPTLPAPVVFGPPTVAFLDVPQLDEGVPAYRPYVAVRASPWYGRAAVYRSPAEDGFALLTTVARSAQMGALAFDFYAGPVGRWDDGNEIWVDLLSGTLSSVSETELFAGANVVAVEGEAGVWEIVQFASAELMDVGRYKLTRLLRGQRGTEIDMRNPAPAGSRLVVLNTNITPLPTTMGDLGVAWNWRIGPASAPVAGSSYLGFTATPRGVGLRPPRPAHQRRTILPDGDLRLSWTRRSRSLAADSWETVDVPLDEPSESYDLEIMDGGNVVRTVSGLTEPEWVYTSADQTTDFGSPIWTVTWRVYQNGALGRGAMAEAVT
jgi:hypothetical protein